MKLQDFSNDQEAPYVLDLGKVAGADVVGVEVFLYTGFGEPCLKIRRIYFKDGTQADVDGEHEVAYIYTYQDHETEAPVGLRNTMMEKLARLSEDYWSNR